MDLNDIFATQEIVQSTITQSMSSINNNRSDIQTIPGQRPVRPKDNLSLDDNDTMDNLLNNIHEGHTLEEVEQIDEKQEQENDSVQIQEEKKEPEISSKKITENKTQKNESKSDSIKTTPVQEQPVVETKSEPEPKEEVKPATTPAKKEEKHEEKIYCVDGGKIHIYGDGANEHGYYKTWDEAFKAYEEYTKGWESTQFKVDQCACGLYYFWVIK